MILVHLVGLMLLGAAICYAAHLISLAIERKAEVCKPCPIPQHTLEDARDG